MKLSFTHRTDMRNEGHNAEHQEKFKADQMLEMIYTRDN
jgi:hypothetical protein